MEINSKLKKWLWSAIRLETISNEDEKFRGTSFLFGKRINEKLILPFLVTTRHMVENQKKGLLFFASQENKELKGKDSISLPIHNFENRWHFHPNNEVDIAILSFSSIIEHIKKERPDVLFNFIHDTYIPSEEDIQGLDASEDLLFIGFPEGLYDTKNKNAVIRKGISATPIELDYELRKEFLIDGPIFHGSSGSPVFIYGDKLEWNENGTMKGFINRSYFVGLISQGKSLVTDGKIITKNSSSTKVPRIETSFHMGHVLKSELIVECIEDFISKNSLDFSKYHSQ